MNTTSLASALGVLRDAVSTHGAHLSAGLRREVGQLALQLLSSLSAGLGTMDDPRQVLQAVELIEEQYRDAVRGQLQAAAALEATGAHALATEEYDRLKSGATVWTQRPVYVAGRSNHRDAAGVLAAWVGIGPFEAAARVADARRLIARRTAAGDPAGPRYARLSEVFLRPGCDPRPARDAARRIEKFEPDPPDSAVPGDPLPDPVAAGPDGVVLEEHVVRVLSGCDRATAAKRVGELCAAFTAARAGERAPDEYFRKVRTVVGVDVYQFAVAGANAEVLRSLVAQWDNPATKAGRAARQAPDATNGNDPANSGPTATSGTAGGTTADRCPGEGAGADGAETDAPWLRSSDPPPEWAIDPDEQNHAGADAGISPEPEPGSGTGPGRVRAMAGQPTRAATTTSTDATTGQGTPGSPVSVERRRLNAFMQLLTQRTTATGTTAQVLPTVNVYLHLSQLLELAHAHGLCNAQGITAHGVKLGPEQLRRLLCDAQVIPYVLGGQGQVLDMGRSRRTFTRAQRQAMLARDRGCIGPGCSYPPERCEGHHWDRGGWAGGCPTSVESGAMLCPIEHDDYHAGKFRIVLVNGLPHVLYPRYIDPTQTPRRNTYWFAAGEPVPGDSPPPLPPLPALPPAAVRPAVGPARTPPTAGPVPPGAEQLPEEHDPAAGRPREDTG